MAVTDAQRHERALEAISMIHGTARTPDQRERAGRWALWLARVALRPERLDEAPKRLRLYISQRLGLDEEAGR